MPFIPALGAGGIIVAAGMSGKQHFDSLIRYPLNWGLAGLSLCLLITSCFAHNPMEAFLGLGNLLPPLAVFAGLTLLIEHPTQLYRLAWLLVAPSSLVVILGIGQLGLAWESPAWLSWVLGWRLVLGGEPLGRMSSVFNYANLLAAYCVIVFLLGIGLWIHCYQHWRQKPLSSHAWSLGLISLLLLIDSAGLILTSSRNAWSLALFGGLVFALYLGWYWIIAMATTAVSLVLGASFAPSPGRDWLRRLVPAYFWARVSDEMYPDRPVETLRLTQWQFSLEMAKERPWIGWGSRNFTPLYQEEMNIWLGHPHNFFLMLVGEVGVPTTLLLCGIVGWILTQGSLLLTQEGFKQHSSNHLIVFTFLVTFLAIAFFNLLDVTLFDLRINTLSWLLLSAISGLVYHHQNFQKKSDYS